MSRLYQAELDETYDDACDLGQCCLNPCWYLFTKVQQCMRQKKQKKTLNGDEQFPVASSRRHLLHKSMGVQYAAYLTTIFGSWAVIFTRFYPLASSSQSYDEAHHLTFGYFLFLACVISWRYAGGTSPGNITHESLHRFDNYEYDGLLYEDGKVCPTVHLRKLARSKFDSSSGTQVPRFDHRCWWIHQSIGEENYRFFCVFLAVHTFMCTYGTWMTFSLIRSEGDFVSSDNTPLSWSETAIVFALVDPWLTVIFVIMGLVSLAIMPFFSFHLYIIANGMTTNEYFKWKLVKDRHQKATLRYGQKTFENAAYVGATSRLSFTDPGPFPLNVYNLGYAANFWEVLSPRSLRLARDRKNA